MSILTRALASVAEDVRVSADELNRLDGFAGDGDFGVTMSIAAEAVIDLLPSLDEQPLADVFKACGAALARKAPSSGGTLVASGLLRASRAATDRHGANAERAAVLLEAARAGITERGKAVPGSKTMLDALAPAAEAAAEAASRGAGLPEVLRRAAEAADAGARATVSMRPRHGRAGWLAERSMGHEDAGARLVAIVLGSAARRAEETRATRREESDLISPHLEGVIPPLVTPFREDEDVDEEAVRREVRYCLDAGVHGLTLTGSTGEGHTLTVEESVRVARTAIDEAKGRVPIVGGIIQDSTRAVIRYGKALKEAGVDALQITPVHYLFAPDAEGTLAYYDEIGNAVQLPIVIYNVVPWNTIMPDTLIKLAEQEWIIAVKQSGGDIHKLADLLRAVRTSGSRLRVLSAVDALLMPSYLLGAHGSVAGILAVLPKLSVELWNACQARDLDRALGLHDRILPIWRVLDKPDMTARVKCAIELQGRRVGKSRRPLQPVSPEVRDEIRRTLTEAAVPALVGV